MKNSVPELNRSNASPCVSYDGVTSLERAGWAVDFTADEQHIFTIEYTYVNGWLNMFEVLVNRHPEHGAPKNIYLPAYFDIVENILVEKYFRKISDNIWQLPLCVLGKRLTYTQFEKTVDNIMKEINNKLRKIV